MTKQNKLLIIVSAMIIIFGCNQHMKNNDEINEDNLIVAKEGVVEIDNFKLKYIRKGNGKPLLIVGTSEYYSKAYSKEPSPSATERPLFGLPSCPAT